MATRHREEHDPDTGLLSAAGLDHTLKAELARAARHELPLSLVLLEVSAPNRALLEDERAGRVAEAVAAAIEERIREEDSAARIGTLRFAVVAVETSEGEALARGLAEHARAALAALRGDGEGLSIAVGGVDCQFDELSRRELVREAERALGAARVAELDVALSPPRSSPSSAERPHRAA